MQLGVCSDGGVYPEGVTQAAGWYPDPAGQDAAFRWWTGDGWTRWLSLDADAPPPGVGGPPGEPITTLDPAAPGPPSPAPNPEPATTRPAGDEPAVRWAVAVAVTVGVLLLALVAVGIVVSASTKALPDGPALPPPVVAPAGVAADLTTRRATVGTVSVTLPAAPYVCTAPRPAAPIFTSAVACTSVVHENYAGEQDWAATAGLGVLDDSLVEDALSTTASNVFDALRESFFSDTATSVTKLNPQRLGDLPTSTVVALTGEVHYQVEGLSSTYDRVVVIVVALEDGRHAAWFSARPDNVSAGTLSSLNTALSTFDVEH